MDVDCEFVLDRFLDGPASGLGLRLSEAEGERDRFLVLVLAAVVVTVAAGGAADTVAVSVRGAQQLFLTGAFSVSGEARPSVTAVEFACGREPQQAPVQLQETFCCVSFAFARASAAANFTGSMLANWGGRSWYIARVRGDISCLVGAVGDTSTLAGRGCG